HRFSSLALSKLVFKLVQLYIQLARLYKTLIQNKSQYDFPCRPMNLLVSRTSTHAPSITEKLQLLFITIKAKLYKDLENESDERRSTIHGSLVHVHIPGNVQLAKLNKMPKPKTPAALSKIYRYLKMRTKVYRRKSRQSRSRHTFLYLKCLLSKTNVSVLYASAGKKKPLKLLHLTILGHVLTRSYYYRPSSGSVRFTKNNDDSRSRNPCKTKWFNLIPLPVHAPNVLMKLIHYEHFILMAEKSRAVALDGREIK
ncbi:hypothetical protein L9F63_013735, partial [Diploptera punctata]